MCARSQTERAHQRVDLALEVLGGERFHEGQRAGADRGEILGDAHIGGSLPTPSTGPEGARAWVRVRRRSSDGEHDQDEPRRQPSAAGRPSGAQPPPRGGVEHIDDAAYAQELQDATVECVRRQRELGIDLPNDGEYGHAMGQKVDYGAWWSYIFGRLGGFGLLDRHDADPGRRPVVDDQIGTLMDRRDWKAFADAYFEPEVGIMSSIRSGEESMQEAFKLPVCDGPLTYTGTPTSSATSPTSRRRWRRRAPTRRSCARSARRAARGSATRTTRPTRSSSSRAPEAMREEYLAITNAGIIVQIDEPSFAESWDQFSVEPTLDEYRKFTDVRVEALNHALRGIPRELVRFHCCWGSLARAALDGHGAENIVDLLREGRGGLVLVRGRQRAPRARVARLAGHRHPRRRDPRARRRRARDERDRAPAARRGPHRALRADRRAATASSRRRTAASAGACTRRSRGRSSRRWPRGRSSWRSSRSAGSARRALP